MKIKKNRRKVDSDDGRPVEDEINDEDLPPEERRRRALDRQWTKH